MWPLPHHFYSFWWVDIYNGPTSIKDDIYPLVEADSKIMCKKIYLKKETKKEYEVLFCIEVQCSCILHSRKLGLSLNDGQTVFFELHFGDKGSRRKTSHPRYVHEVHNFQGDEWLRQSWTKIFETQQRWGRAQCVWEACWNFAWLMLVLNVVIENMERVGREGQSKRKWSEVIKRRRLSHQFSLLTLPNKPIKILFLWPRESSHPVLRCVKKKISSEEKLPQDPPAFSPGRGGVWGARQAQLLRPTRRRQSGGRLRRGQCTNLLFPV